MKNYTKKIFFAIALVIAGLFITSTISISAIKINKTNSRLSIEKIETELQKTTIKSTNINKLLKTRAMPLANYYFAYAGNQVHPGFDFAYNGEMLAAYYDDENENIIWTFEPENGVYYDVGGDYPTIKNWDETRFFASFVPDSSDSDGGIVYLFETTDPTDFDTYDLVGWDWSDNGWSNILDLELACDDSKENWEWGFISLVASTTYGDGVTDGPFVTYPTSEDGYATISWYIGLDGCAHTDNVIDHVSYKAYSVYDWLDPDDDTWKILIRLDYYDDWDKDGTAYVYSGDDDIKNPAVAANDDDLIVVMQADTGSDSDIICFYGNNLDKLKTGAVVDSGDDETYPDIQHITGDTYVVTYCKNGNIYGILTENAGSTWGEPFMINDNEGSVAGEYKFSDLSTVSSLVLWQEEYEDLDIYIGSATGNEPPNAPTMKGPKNGDKDKKYDFTFSAVDPEGDNVYLFVDWGDGTDSGWVGPYNSAESVILSHTWSQEEKFTITAKAKDEQGLFSLVSTFSFSTPKIKANLLNILERLSILQNIFLMFLQ